MKQDLQFFMFGFLQDVHFVAQEEKKLMQVHII